jgi:hypothetical protein
MASRPRSPSPPLTSDPLPIRRLSESLINRIAAGEVQLPQLVHLFRDRSWIYALDHPQTRVSAQGTS